MDGLRPLGTTGRRPPRIALARLLGDRQVPIRHSNAPWSDRTLAQRTNSPFRHGSPTCGNVQKCPSTKGFTCCHHLAQILSEPRPECVLAIASLRRSVAPGIQFWGCFGRWGAVTRASDSPPSFNVLHRLSLASQSAIAGAAQRWFRASGSCSSPTAPRTRRTFDPVGLPPTAGRKLVAGSRVTHGHRGLCRGVLT